MVVVVDNAMASPRYRYETETKVETSRIAGFDFGLKVFLTISDGTQSDLAFGNFLSILEWVATNKGPCKSFLSISGICPVRLVHTVDAS